MNNNPYTNYSTDQLWNMSINGNKKSFQYLFDKLFDDLMSYGCKLSKNQSDVKDAIQEVFTDIWINRNTRNISNIKFYLLKSLRHKLNRSKPVINILDLDPIYFEKLVSTKDDHSIQPKTIQEERLDKEINLLPKNQKAGLNTLRLRHYIQPMPLVVLYVSQQLPNAQVL